MSKGARLRAQREANQRRENDITAEFWQQVDVIEAAILAAKDGPPLSDATTLAIAKAQVVALARTEAFRVTPEEPWVTVCGPAEARARAMLLVAIQRGAPCPHVAPGVPTLAFLGHQLNVCAMCVGRVVAMGNLDNGRCDLCMTHVPDNIFWAMRTAFRGFTVLGDMCRDCSTVMSILADESECGDLP